MSRDRSRTAKRERGHYEPYQTFLQHQSSGLKGCVGRGRRGDCGVVGPGCPGIGALTPGCAAVGGLTGATGSTVRK